MTIEQGSPAKSAGSAESAGTPKSAGATAPGRQVEILAGTVLPARRERVTLSTADGLSLVGEVALPAEGPVRATMVCLHPLPTHGGSMNSHVFRKAAWRLPALAGIAVVRFNTRGTSSDEGTSEGEFDFGTAERYDLAAALDLVDAGPYALPAPWLVGWSFGTEVLLLHGWQDPDVAGGIMLSPPLRRAGDPELDAWAASGKPLVALVPEFDDYLQPPEARARFARVPQCEVVGVDGAKHLWVGEKYVHRVLSEIVARLVPGGPPLPHTVPAGMVEA